MGGWEDLLAGYQRFRRIDYPGKQDTYRALAAEGQSPGIMVIGCCDSRVDPAAIFDAGPGELFVLRNVANLVPPYTADSGHHGTSAAIEFAVGTLGVGHIVVLGHASCGGIQALAEDGSAEAPTDTEDSNIGRWMSIAHPALQQAKGGQLTPGSDDFSRTLEQAVIGLSLENLNGFPAVREGIAAGRLEVHGAWFNIKTGALHLMDTASGVFSELPPGPPSS
jgi:carbonic anhydrase